jgi:tetratricopeptide (TPR) repeat protein
VTRNNPRPSEKSSKPAESGAGAPAAHWLGAALVAIVTCITFLPALGNDFVGWDDDDNFIDNPNYRGLGWSQLYWMFTTFHSGPYQPLSWVTLGIDYLLWGMNPFGYHLTNIILHAATAVFFYYVSRRLLSLVFSLSDEGGQWQLSWSAAFAALLFSIHPLRAESVAWVTERRDVLSGFFYMWTIDCYLRANSLPRDDPRSIRWRRTALVAFVLTMLSKAIAMSIPAVLLLLDIYPLRRLGWNVRQWLAPAGRAVLKEKIPFVVVALLFASLAIVGQQQAAALKSLDHQGATSRLAQAFFGLGFYVWKTLFPAGLSPLYERAADFTFRGRGVFLGASGAIIATLSLYRFRERWPAGLACWIYYVVVLAPVLGIVSTGPQLVADRYSYLSCLSWAVLIGGALIPLWRFLAGLRSRWLQAGAGVAAALLLLTLGGLTWKQSQIWHDPERLWRHALSIAPSSIAHYNLGIVLARKGVAGEAIEQYRRSLAIAEARVDPHYYLANLLAARGEIEEAGKHYRRAAELAPNDGAIQTRLGLFLAGQGNVDAAMVHFKRALEINPGDTLTLNNLGAALARQGKAAEALRYFRRAIDLNPSDAESHANIANAFLALGETQNAVSHLIRAVEINPDDAGNQNNLAIVLARQGDLKEAVKYLRRVVALKPQDAGAYTNLAIGLAQHGELSEAENRFKQALGLDPNLSEAHVGLARLLAAEGKADEAAKHYREALRILRSTAAKSPKGRETGSTKAQN